MCPLLVGDIARISQAVAIVFHSIFIRPHRRSSTNQAAYLESQVIQGTQELPAAALRTVDVGDYEYHANTHGVSTTPQICYPCSHRGQMHRLQLEQRAMLMTRILAAMLVFSFVLCTGTSALRAADCEAVVARHMVGQALLAAQFVALAEKAGMTPSEINAILK